MPNINRYRKFVVALIGAAGAIWGPEAAQGLIAFLTAAGVYLASNEA